MDTRIIPTPGDLGTVDASRAHVVVDVLRFSTTVPVLLDEGARYVYPLGSLHEAQAFREGNRAGLLLGEHEARDLEGFDANNSPTAVRERLDVHDRPVGLLTTNGSRAVRAVEAADVVLVAGLVNLTAAADHLRDLDRDVTILACGWKGEASPEDVAAARLLAEVLHKGAADDDLLQETRETVRTAPSAHDLRDLGFVEDVELASQVDAVPVVARLVDGVLLAAPH